MSAQCCLRNGSGRGESFEHSNRIRDTSEDQCSLCTFLAVLTVCVPRLFSDTKIRSAELGLHGCMAVGDLAPVLAAQSQDLTHFLASVMRLAKQGRL